MQRLFSPNTSITTVCTADLAIAMAGTQQNSLWFRKTSDRHSRHWSPIYCRICRSPKPPSGTVFNSGRAKLRLLLAQSLLRDPERLQLIAENGVRRMEAGAANRIAARLMEQWAKRRLIAATLPLDGSLPLQQFDHLPFLLAGFRHKRRETAST